MNYIQRAWLRVLAPVAKFTNEKLAKKSGIFGRIGRFYSFGPREFGYHPSNKLLAYVNSAIINSIALNFHKHSFFKSLTQNGFVYSRPHRYIMLLGMVGFWATIYMSVTPENEEVEEGTSLEYFRERLQTAPINALQNRQSAHYTEINNYYQHEMLLYQMAKQGQILSKRQYYPQKLKKTRFARPGYEYIAPHSNYVEIVEN